MHLKYCTWDVLKIEYEAKNRYSQGTWNIMTLIRDVSKKIIGAILLHCKCSASKCIAFSVNLICHLKNISVETTGGTRPISK